MKLSEIANVSSTFGAHGPLLDLFDSWASRVLKLLRDSAGEGPIDTAWGPDDLVGAYYIRDAISRAMEGLRDRSAPPTLTAVDSLLTTFTTVEKRSTLAAYAPEMPEVGWWWERIPARGPLREELDLDVAVD